MMRHFKNSFRMLRIGWVLARNDALFPLEQTRLAPAITLICWLFRKPNRQNLRDGERLAIAIQRLGPSFIKLGQSLSTRSDIIGEQVAQDLGNLRDKLPPFPFPQVKAIIEEEFEQDLTKIYPQFDETPIAAASIAQVHFAVTPEGEEVAVKIIRPDVKQKFSRDLELFHWMAELIATRPGMERFKAREVVDTFAESVAMELDLRFEASGATELRENVAQDESFYVPKVCWQLTSERVLTLERIQGTKISDIEALKAKNFDFEAIVTIAAQGFFNQVFRDGFFHADLHPGNLFVLDDGRVAVVDFGIMGRVSWKERLYLIEILQGFLTGNYRRVAEMHFNAGYVPAHKNIDNFTVACRAIGEPILGLPLDQISVAKLLAQLFKVAEDFEMVTQPQLLLLQKTMMVAEGVGRMLLPNVNMWQLAEPLVFDWATQNLGVKAKLKTTHSQLLSLAERLPRAVRQMENILQKVDNGGLKLHPDTLASLLSERRRSHNHWLLLAWAGLFGFMLVMFAR